MANYTKDELFKMLRRKIVNANIDKKINELTNILNIYMVDKSDIDNIMNKYCHQRDPLFEKQELNNYFAKVTLDIEDVYTNEVIFIDQYIACFNKDGECRYNVFTPEEFLQELINIKDGKQEIKRNTNKDEGRCK